MKKVLLTWSAGLLASLTMLVFAATPLVLAQAQTGQEQINAGLCAGSNFEISTNPTQTDCSSNDSADKLSGIIHDIVNILSAIVGVAAVIMIIFGGLRYITSGGNDTSVTSAKNTILYAIIGLIIVALAQIIVRFTLNKLTQ